MSKSEPTNEFLIRLSEAISQIRELKDSCVGSVSIVMDIESVSSDLLSFIESHISYASVENKKSIIEIKQIGKKLPEGVVLNLIHLNKNRMLQILEGIKLLIGEKDESKRT